MKLIFFLITAIITSLAFSQPAFANHIANQTDDFEWREHDNSVANSVWCEMDGTAPLGDRVSFQCKGGSYDGHTRDGEILISKVFNKSDIRSGTLTNVFTWTWDIDCTQATCGIQFISVLDGAYDYKSLSMPGGFPNNADWNIWNNPPNMGVDGSDNTNFFGAGNLGITGGGGANDAHVACTASNYSVAKGSQSLSCSVTNSLWNESTEDQITVILWVNNEPGTITNEYISPKTLEITNTPVGTMTWHFPITTDEATDWTSFFDATQEPFYETNGTESDHGYFFSLDPSVPDPPTDLYAVTSSSNIILNWTAPVFTGLSPIIGYKIERESPVGNGFSTLVASTGNSSTTYTDNTIVAGHAYNYRVSAQNTYGTGLPSNESRTGVVPTPTTNIFSCTSRNSTFELFNPSLTDTTVGLCWDTASGNVTSYEVFYTSPWGVPVINIQNNTSTTHSTRISNLTPATQYSFQVNATIATPDGWCPLCDVVDIPIDASYTPTPLDVKISPDGMNMYIADRYANTISQYSDGSPWDFQNTNAFVYNYTTPDDPDGLFLKPDGTELYTLDDFANTIRVYDFGTPWDLSTLSPDATYSIPLIGSNYFSGLYITPDGTSMFIGEFTDDYIYKYTMSPWDFSTLTYDSFYAVPLRDPGGISFKSDGLMMFTSHVTDDELYQYTLTSPWNLSTVMINGNQTIPGGGNDGDGWGIDVSNNDTQLYQAIDDLASTQRIIIWNIDPYLVPNVWEVSNILNVTTTGANSFAMGNFSIPTGSNPALTGIKLTVTDVNGTRKKLDVDYLNSLTLQCNFAYKFAGTNATYSVNGTTLDSSYDRASFNFDDVQNEIINVRCYDDNNEAKKVITQNTFPFLEQIQNFRNGTYGTSGEFGNFDLITLIVIILSMIGFNRVAGHVGTLFVAIVLFMLAWFGVIRVETVVFSIPALVVLTILSILVHNREDVSD